MKTAQRNEFEQVAGHLNAMMDKLWQWHTSDFSRVDSWSPPVNVYRFETRIEVCVDLAGVDRKQTEVRVEPGIVTIRGIRNSPEPKHNPSEPMRVYTMEINHGPFLRTIRLSDAFDMKGVESNYVDGILWIRLPLTQPK